MRNRNTLRTHELIVRPGSTWLHHDEPSDPPARGRGRAAKATLCVAVEVDGFEPEEARHRVRQQIESTYYADPSRSLTSRLIRAVRSGHGLLTTENEAAIREHRHFGRVACAAVRDGELYGVLAGGATAYLFSSGVARALVEEPEPNVRVTLLGGHDDPETQLLRRELRPGEAVILATGVLVGLCEQTGATASELLLRWQRVYRGPTQRIIVVGLERPGSSALVDDGEILRQAVEDEARVAAAAGTLVATAAPALSLPTTMRVEVPAAEDEVYSDVQVGDRLVSFLENTGDSFHRASYRISRLLVMSLAVVMLVLAAAVCVYLPLRIAQDRSLGNNVGELVAMAEELENQARVSTDPVQRRELITEAFTLVDRATRLRRDEAAVEPVQARLQAQLDELNGVIRPSRVVRLGDLDGELVGMVQADSALILVDSGGQRAMVWPLQPDGFGIASDAAPLVLRAGDELHGQVLAPFQAVAWVPPGSTRLEGVAVLVTRSGQLIEYQPGQEATLVRANLGGASIVAGYAGSLYALSPTDGTLKWYMPVGRGYDGPPYDYFAPGVSANLADVSSLAVGGDVYLLHASGEVERFSAGKPQPFAVEPPDLPIRQAAALALTQEGLFVADPINRRIVQLDRDGTFHGQIRGDASDEWSDDIRALAVDLARRCAFVVSGDEVFAVGIGVR